MYMTMKTVLFLSVVFSSLGGVPWAGAGEPIDIGSRRELMIDSFLIDRSSGGAALRLHHPIRRDIAIVHDDPWEGNAGGYHAIFRDDAIYRMYYHAWHIPEDGAQNHPVTIGYAESDDGIRWRKPKLGLHEINGSKENNIVLTNVHGGRAHDFSPFVDPNPNATSEGKYKAIGLGWSPGGLYAFRSTDAIRWHRMQEKPVFQLKGWVFDTQNITFWSELENQYVLYYRITTNDVRWIGRAVSDDYLNWADEGLIECDRPPNKLEQFYTNQIKPYYRAPHIYIGFPACYVDRGWIPATEELPQFDLRKKRAKTSSRYGSAVTDSLIMTSRDGRRFHRWDRAFLRPGLRTQHNWSYGDNYMAWHVVETKSTEDDEDRELSLYAIESYFTGKISRLRRYTLRLDGFASVNAPLSGGEWISKVLRFKGDRLTINFSTSAAGSLRVELQRPDGSALPGYALENSHVIFGDSLEHSVGWKEKGTDVSNLAGQPIRLRFELRDADLYALQFK